MTSRRHSARARLLAAIHEAGHVVMTRRVRRLVLYVAIWPAGDDDWRGQMRYLGTTGGSRAQILIAAAGAAAEANWTGCRALVPEADAAAIGDAAALGQDVAEVIAACRWLVRRDGPLWADIVAETHRILRPWRLISRFRRWLLGY